MPRIRSISPRLHVHDLSRAIDFYTGVLGFTVDSVFPPSQPLFALLTRDGVGLQLAGVTATGLPVRRQRAPCGWTSQTFGRCTVRSRNACRSNGDRKCTSTIGASLAFGISTGI